MKKTIFALLITILFSITLSITCKELWAKIRLEESNKNYEQALIDAGKLLRIINVKNKCTKYKKKVEEKMLILNKEKKVNDLLVQASTALKAKQYKEVENLLNAAKEIMQENEKVNEIFKPAFESLKNKLEEKTGKKVKTNKALTAGDLYGLAQEAEINKEWNKAIEIYKKLYENEIDSEKGKIMRKIIYCYFRKFQTPIALLIVFGILFWGFKFIKEKKEELEIKEHMNQMTAQAQFLPKDTKEAKNVIKLENEANKAYSSGNFKKAIKIYEKILNTNVLSKKKGVINAYIARCYLKMIDPHNIDEIIFKKALQHAQEGAKLAPDEPQVWHILAQIASLKNLTDSQSIKAYEYSVDLKIPRIIKTLGKHYKENNKMVADVIEIYEINYFEYNDESFEEILYKTYVNNADLSDNAYKLYMKYYKEGKIDKDGFYLLLEAKLQRKDFDFVKEKALELLEENPNDVTAHELLQKAYRETDNLTELLEVYKQLNEKYKDNAYIKKTLADLQQTFSLQLEDVNVDEEGFKICPNCASLNPASAKNCEKCGAELI